MKIPSSLLLLFEGKGEIDVEYDGQTELIRFLRIFDLLIQKEGMFFN